MGSVPGVNGRPVVGSMPVLPVAPGAFCTTAVCPGWPIFLDARFAAGRIDVRDERLPVCACSHDQKFVVASDESTGAVRQRNFLQPLAGVPIVVRELARLAHPDVLAGNVQLQFSLQVARRRFFDLALGDSLAELVGRLRLIYARNRFGDLVVS